MKKDIKQLFFAAICGGYFFMTFGSASAFLGEDLGLELYKNIDEGFYTLEQKQYEYEMTGQGETTVNEVVNPILAESGIECDISSTQEIERLLGNAGGNQIATIIEKCSKDGNPVPVVLAENVTNSLGNIRNTFHERAADKAKRSYELARIGLYSDGNIENSPFDLIYDIQEIDKIIFGEELEYNGVPYQNADEALDDFLEENKDYLYEDDDDEDEGENDEIEDTSTGSVDDPLVSVPDIGDHVYMCPVGDDSGLDDDMIGDIINDIEGGTNSVYTPNPNVWLYPDTEITNGASWGGPFPASGPSGGYSDVRDSWKCSKFFCIVVEFQKSSYGLAGGKTISIKKVLSKAAKHLEKPANASLTQRKMTTNNFELGSVIKNLAGMLRGFGIEVQSKPVPILDVENENENLLGDEGDQIEDQLSRYYKNLGLDYKRRNDLDYFHNTGEITKILQSSADMPVTYIEKRSNELNRFQTALTENNRLLAVSVDNTILQKDMKKFGDQFTELEKFVDAMEDFVKSIKGIIGELKKIPTRSS